METSYNYPLFFTRDNAVADIAGNYKGASIFIICNGPSLVSGQYDLSLLEDSRIIKYGMNNGPKTIVPNLWTCVDKPCRFMSSIWRSPNILKIVPRAYSEEKVFDNEAWEDLKVNGKNCLVGDCPNVLYFKRNEKFNASRFLFEETINWGNHKDYGDGRSVLLPVIRVSFSLGFRKIYLVGADFKMDQNKGYHFDEEVSIDSVAGNSKTFRRMNSEYLPQLLPFLRKEGVELYNCTKDSGLNSVPYLPYEEAISRSISEVGNFKSKTVGLYKNG